MAIRVSYGVNAELEEAATALILASLEGETSREAKSDFLTPWKMKHRQTHEILTRSGAQVDPSIMRGQFTKAYNPDKPHLNSREGPGRAPKMSSNWDPDNAQPSGYLSPQFAAVVGVERLD